MSESSAGFAKSLREEINALLGIRWDSLVEWVVIAWLSAWTWAAIFSDQGPLPGWGPSSGEGHGPLTGIGLFLENLDASSPGWFSAVMGWLHDPAHNWVYYVFLLTAVTTSVTAARNSRHTGLRVLALLSTAIACEMNGSLWPVAWVLLLAAVPALWACGIDWVGRKSDEGDGDRYYFAPGILMRFLTRIAFLFLLPLAAPFLLLGQLVVSFRTDLPYSPAKEISNEVITVLTARGADGPSALDPLTEAASSAAISLAGNQSREAREVLISYHFALKRRREAEGARKRREAKPAGRSADSSFLR